MDIHCKVRRSVRCDPAAAFDLLVDPARFAGCFPGYGPIPAIHAIEMKGALAVGCQRTIRNRDGSVLTEQVTALQRPTRHAYRLTGLRPPFSWLVREGRADWRLQQVADGCVVDWRYAFTLVSPLAWPVAAPLLSLCFARAMHRSLARVGELLESSPRTATGDAPAGARWKS